MSAFFRGVALLVAITCVVWIGVLWRWQATARDMSATDIVVYLGLLPLVAFGFALLLRWAWQGAQARQEAAAAAAAAAPAAAPAPAPSADERQRHATVQILAATLASAAGASAAELQAAAKDGQPRPDLDPDLRDDDGLPVFTARIAGLDLEAIAPALEQAAAALAQRDGPPAPPEPPEHVARAVAALHRPLLEAALALEPWAARFAPPKDAPAPEHVPLLRVVLGFPADWPAIEVERARLVVAAWLAEAGAVPLPPRGIVVQAVAAHGAELLRQADRLLQTLAREQRSDVLLLAAAHSDLSADAVAALERQGLLFAGGRRPKGRMPGEAAAALLLAPPDWPADPAAEAPPPHLHRPALLQRDKPVDAPGRVASDVLREAIAQSLALAALAPDAVGALACDGDQHTARGTELFGATLQQLPHLDAAEDLRLLASVTGAVGAVGPLLAVACAAELVRDGGKACVAATLGDPTARLALLVRPAPAETGQEQR